MFNDLQYTVKIIENYFHFVFMAIKRKYFKSYVIKEISLKGPRELWSIGQVIQFLGGKRYRRRGLTSQNYRATDTYLLWQTPLGVVNQDRSKVCNWHSSRAFTLTSNRRISSLHQDKSQSFEPSIGYHLLRNVHCYNKRYD